MDERTNDTGRDREEYMSFLDNGGQVLNTHTLLYKMRADCLQHVVHQMWPHSRLPAERRN